MMTFYFVSYSELIDLVLHNQILPNKTFNLMHQEFPIHIDGTPIFYLEILDKDSEKYIKQKQVETNERKKDTETF